MRPARNARRIRPACALLCGLALLPALAGGGLAGEIRVKAVPVELNPQKPGAKTVGRLVFMRGFELVSDHGRFGGLSGLDISPDGRRLRAVSDLGNWITAELTHDADGRLIAAESWRAAPLLTPTGDEVNGLQRDAEGLTRDFDGSFLVSFEQDHRIWRYPRDLHVPPAPVATPFDLTGAPRNGGLEGITLLPDGTVLGITEKHANGDGGLKGWLMKNGAALGISYVPRKGFSPTDLAALPNGDVLLLERSFHFIAMRARVVRLSRTGLAAGATVHGGTVAHLQRPLTVDNFEGLAVRRDRAGRTLLYLVSDNNFLAFQRTLLLQFRMIDDL